MEQKQITEFLLAIYVQGLKDYVSAKRTSKVYGDRYLNESAQHIRTWLVNSELASQLLDNPETFMNTFDMLENQLYKERKKIRFNRVLDGLM